MCFNMYNPCIFISQVRFSISSTPLPDLYASKLRCYELQNIFETQNSKSERSKNLHGEDMN